MPLGNELLGPQQQRQPIHPALAQAMAPQAVSQGGQAAQQGGGLGAAFQNLKQNPAAIQMLLQSGAQLLNPQQFGSAGGRIAQAVNDGVSGYNELNQQAEQQEFERGVIEQREDREDRKVDLTEAQIDQADDQFLKNFGLEGEKLEGQKALWKAQIDRYGAEAEALRKKNEEGPGQENLTGPERIINNLATILTNNEVPADRAYTMAFDIYNKSSESESNAIAGAAESLAFLASTPKGQELYDKTMGEIQQAFRSGTDLLQDVQEQNQPVAENVSRGEVEQALQAINQNDGTDLQWDSLTEQQQNQVIQEIQRLKAEEGAQ